MTTTIAIEEQKQECLGQKSVNRKLSALVSSAHAIPKMRLETNSRNRQVPTSTVKRRWEITAGGKEGRDCLTNTNTDAKLQKHLPTLQEELETTTLDSFLSHRPHLNGPRMSKMEDQAQVPKLDNGSPPNRLSKRTEGKTLQSLNLSALPQNLGSQTHIAGSPMAADRSRSRESTSPPSLPRHPHNSITLNHSSAVATNAIPQQSRALTSGPCAMARDATPPRNNHAQYARGSQIDPALERDWQTYTVVEIFVTALPIDVTTFDIYKNFIRFGEIVKIKILGRNEGNYKPNAEIRFRQPLTGPFWQITKKSFKDSRGCEHDVNVRLARGQPKNFTKPSPSRPEIQFNTLTELEAESLGFGVLTSLDSMKVLRTRSSQPSSKVSKVKLRLELARKELDVVFPVGKDKDHVLYEQHPHFRPEYRFRISSDQHFRVFRVDEADRTVSFIISLKTPPPYTKKDHAEVENSHQSDGKWWDENAVWLRQTNIISQSKDMDKVTARPLALNGSENAINIGRWTAYRIVFDLKTVNANDLRIMTEALQDFFDVKVEHLPKLTYSKPTSTVWDVLEEHAKAGLSNLHPIILPFAVRYMLEVCISNGRLHEYDVPELFLRRLQEAGETKSMHHLKHILDLNNEKAERILFDPMSSYDASQYLPKLRKEPKLPNGCALIYSATVTATTIIFNAPSVEITNRIIRQHSQHFDRFLRVRFEDDKYRGDSRIYAQTTNKLDALFKRVRRTLTHGIILGDRHYEFLAWGNSQLREHGAYFFAKLPGVMSASKIRAEMGEFKHEKVIAKHAARMGQCFSTTKAVGYRVPLDSTTTLIDDAKRGKYNFTDGVGQISQLLAQLVNGELKLAKTAPSAFQFRLGGCKGVLAVHKGLQSINIGLRHSQQKFQSTARILEIIRHSAKSDAHLNRQLILVLSALGVGDEVFNNMIAREIGALDEAMENGAVARKELSRSIDENAMTPEISRLVEQGFHDIREPFVTNVLQLWRAWRLKYLKEKAKLHIPNGACLLGCTDETGTLQGHFDNSGRDPHSTYQEQYKHLPQIFVQVRRRAGADDARNEEDVPYEVIEGLCWIARNPSLHEGDIRVVKAVNVPALSHLRDVLVLPQTGDQDLSSMCSGGDLDGDDYIVVWAEDKTGKKFDLLPSKWNAKPMDYTPPDAVKASGNNVTQNDIINFFDTYMRSDFLGKIAVAHLGWADAEDDGIRSEKCLKLAQEHSKAVDYPKTGVPAELTTKLQPQKWPHFMERKAGLSYPSYKILGQLYDRVKDLYKVHKVDGLAGEARRGHFHVDYDPNKFDARILTACEPSEFVTEFVKSLKWEYDIHLRRIMAKHEISTEFEVWSTFVLDHSKACSDYKFYEEMGNLSRSLKQQFEEELVLEAKGRSVDALKPYAVAAYRLAQSECKEARNRQEAAEDGVREQMPYISFPWLLHDTLGAIAQSSQSREHADSSAHTDIAESGNIAMKNSIRAGATWLNYPDPYQAPPANGSELSSGSQKVTKAAALPKLATASVAADRPAQEPGLLLIGSTDQAATSLSSLSDLQGLSLTPTHRLSDDGHYMSPLRRRSTQSRSSGSQLQSPQSSLVPLAREKTEDGDSDEDGEVYGDPAAMER